MQGKCRKSLSNILAAVISHHMFILFFNFLCVLFVFECEVTACCARIKLNCYIALYHIPHSFLSLCLHSTNNEKIVPVYCTNMSSEKNMNSSHIMALNRVCSQSEMSSMCLNNLEKYEPIAACV